MPTKFTAKVGTKSVNPASKGSSPARGPSGAAGGAFPRQPFPPPAGSGQPIAMRKALKKKTPHGSMTGFPGSMR